MGDRYESERNNYKRGGRRSRRQLKMSSITRENMLLNVFDVPRKELIEAEKKVKKIQKQRRRSSSEPVILAQMIETTGYNKLGRKLKKCGISMLKGFSDSVVNSEMMIQSPSNNACGLDMIQKERRRECTMFHSHNEYGY